MIRLKTTVAAASLLCITLAGCEFGGRDEDADRTASAAAADKIPNHGQRRESIEATADDPIARAREAQEAEAAREVAEAQLRVQADLPEQSPEQSNQ
jgi:hypothetical protein